MVGRALIVAQTVEVGSSCAHLKAHRAKGSVHSCKKNQNNNNFDSKPKLMILVC